MHVRTQSIIKPGISPGKHMSFSPSDYLNKVMGHFVLVVTVTSPRVVVYCADIVCAMSDRRKAYWNLIT
jgi:hypothetical protein